MKVVEILKFAIYFTSKPNILLTQQNKLFISKVRGDKWACKELKKKKKKKKKRQKQVCSEEKYKILLKTAFFFWRNEFST